MTLRLSRAGLPGTPTTVSLIGVGVLAGVLTVLVQWPLAQALRWLPDATQGSLFAADGSARGRWHDGNFRLLCRIPGGQALHCGDMAVNVGLLRGPGAPGLQAQASQTGGGTLRWVGKPGDVSPLGVVTLNQWRMPMDALATWLPAVAQLQLGGPVWIDGSVQAGLPQLNLRWRSEIAGFSTGEQKMRVIGSPEQIHIEFLPPAADETPPIALAGGARCSFSRVGTAGMRCQGELEIRSDGKNARLDNLLLAVAPKSAPGVFKLRFDAR